LPKKGITEHLHLIEGPLQRQAGSDGISASSDEKPLTILLNMEFFI